MADVPFVEGKEKEVPCLCGSKLGFMQSYLGEVYVYCTNCDLSAPGDSEMYALAQFFVAYMEKFEYPNHEILHKFCKYKDTLAEVLSETEYKSFTDWALTLLSNAGLIMPLDYPGPRGYMGGFTCPCGYGLHISVDDLVTAECYKCNVASHPSIDLPTALWGFLVEYRAGLDVDAWCDKASKFLESCEQILSKEEYDKLYNMAVCRGATAAPPPKQNWSDMVIEFIKDDTDTEERKENMSSDANPEVTNTQALIIKKCDELKELLLEKNRKYGDSAINPCRVFSRASATEQILVRMDDKINRIKNRQNDEDEDVIKDLAGYCILYMIAKEKESE